MGGRYERKWLHVNRRLQTVEELQATLKIRVSVVQIRPWAPFSLSIFS